MRRATDADGRPTLKRVCTLEEKGESLVLGWSEGGSGMSGVWRTTAEGAAKRKRGGAGAGALPLSVLFALPLPPGRQQPPTFWNAKEPLQGPFADPFELFIFSNEQKKLRLFLAFSCSSRLQLNCHLVLLRSGNTRVLEDSIILESS